MWLRPARRRPLAWGADVDLFARGVAEQVDNPKIFAEAAENPGTIIKLARGTAEEHLASAGTPKAKPRKKEGSVPAEALRAKPPPRPSRKALDIAEQKLVDHLQSVEARIEELEAERARIGKLIAQARKAGEGEAVRLQAVIDKVRAKYEEALDRWRGTS